MKTTTLNIMCRLLIDTDPSKLKSLGFYNQDIHIALQEATDYLKLEKDESFEEFCGKCSNAVSDILIDLNKLNIGSAKDKLYILLQESAKLSRET